MKKEIKKFIDGNRRRVFRNFVDYIEAQVEAESYEEMESFTEWIEEEYKIARREKTTGEGNYI